MIPELEIAELRRRLLEYCALLQPLFEQRWQLVIKAARDSDEHAQRALLINEETVTAVWRTVRRVQLRLADLELIVAGQQENFAAKTGSAPGKGGVVANLRLQARHRPPFRDLQKHGSRRYWGTNDR
jgi:hypothetical protein